MWPCIVTNFFVIKPTNALISQIYFVMKLYVFQTVLLSIIRSLFAVHSAMVYVIQFCRQLSSRSCSKAVYKYVWHTPLLSVQRINSWWWTEELSETRRVSWQNKFVKLVHLVGFISKKSVETNCPRNKVTFSCHVMPHLSVRLPIAKISREYSASSLMK
jgi:hypothetical protein